MPAMFDLHVHSAPCVVPRIADDRQTVTWFVQAGFDGCVLKGHGEPTVGRAVAAAHGTGLVVRGGIVLNHAVGGLNPDAVDASLSLGGRVVWMPTLDALAHLDARLPRPASPSDAPAIAIPPRDPANEGAVRRIMASVAAADAVLATGHVSAAEVGWLVRAAREAGVRRVLVTHASFTVPDLSVADVRELAELGAYVEITAYQLLHQAGCDAARLASVARAVGADRLVLSSDAGQPDSPPAPDALLRLVEALAGEGLDTRALEAAASETPQTLVG
jgi:hypothetical protein